jgi:hypothetical protein
MPRAHGSVWWEKVALAAEGSAWSYLLKAISNLLLGPGLEDLTVAHGASNIADLKVMGRGGLSTDRVVGTIVDDNVFEVLSSLGSNHRQGAHVHNGGAITI